MSCDIKNKNYSSKSDIIKQKLLNNDGSYFSKKVKYENDIFILSKNIIRINQTNVVCKSSKLEENVYVYNGKKYFDSHEMINSLNKKDAIELMKVLAFRKIIGMNDTCTRNILYYDGHFYTIDDPVLLKTTSFMFKVHAQKYETAYVNIHNFKEIQKFLSECEEIIGNSEDLPDNIKSFILAQISEYMIAENWKF